MKNWALQFLASLVTATAPLPLSAQQAADSTDNGYGMWEWNWGHTLFGHLPMVAIWLAAFALLVLALWRPGHRNRETPLDILRQRYARGEITNGEFEERRRLLSD